jgi:hypothetical protein
MAADELADAPAERFPQFQASSIIRIMLMSDVEPCKCDFPVKMRGL